MYAKWYIPVRVCLVVERKRRRKGEWRRAEKTNNANVCGRWDRRERCMNENIDETIIGKVNKTFLRWLHKQAGDESSMNHQVKPWMKILLTKFATYCPSSPPTPSPRNSNKSGLRFWELSKSHFDERETALCVASFAIHLVASLAMSFVVHQQFGVLEGHHFWFGETEHCFD